MSKLFRNLLVLTSFFLCSAISAEEGVVLEKQIEGTNVTAVAPNGWWVNAHIYSTVPTVFFTLPHPSKGPYEVSPELSVQILNPKLKIYTLGAYEKYLIKSNRSKRPVKVFYFSLGKRQGFVHVSQSDRMVHIVDATGMPYTIITETVVLQDGNQLYSCNLVTRHKKYSAYKGTAAKLCASLRFNPA